MTSRVLGKKGIYAEGDKIHFDDGIYRGYGRVVESGEITGIRDMVYKVACNAGNVFDKASQKVVLDITTLHVYHSEVIGVEE